MVKAVRVLLMLSLLPSLGISITRASPEEYKDAIDAYESAASDVDAALQAYSSCISTSEGRDDCSLEFSVLQSAQDDFESAVSDYDFECS